MAIWLIDTYVCICRTFLVSFRQYYHIIGKTITSVNVVIDTRFKIKIFHYL